MRRTLLALVLAGAAAPVAAGSLSSTVTLASDYVFDGVSQTDEDPALQASLDFEAENGFYVGIWGSNVDFGPDDPADVEIDLYAGFAGEFGDGWGFDVGVVTYLYTGAPSEGYDYTEVYGGLTFPIGTEAMVWLADDDDVFGGSTWRFKLKHSFELSETLSLDLEGTRTNYSDSESEDFTHFQIGFTKTLGRFDAYLGYSDTTIDDEPLADGRVIFTISTTFEFF